MSTKPARARFGVRDLMIGVAASGVVIAGLSWACETIPTVLDDQFFGAETTVEACWEVDAPPRIVVEACDGGIWIEPGELGKVRATVTKHCVCKNLPPEDAGAGLAALLVEMAEEADTIRVESRRPSGGASPPCHLSTSITLQVPDGSRLDLRTNVGSIQVKGAPAEVRAENKAGAFRFILDRRPDPSGNPLASPPLVLEGYHGLVQILKTADGDSHSGPVR
jgi:hypothetical protein